MASLLTAELPSDDEEDQDFVPEAETLSKSPSSKRAPPAATAPLASAQNAAKRAKVDAVWDLLNQKAAVHRAPPKPAVQTARPALDQQSRVAPAVKDLACAAAAGAATKAANGNAVSTSSQQKDKSGEDLAPTSRAVLAARAAAAGLLGQKASSTVTRHFAGKDIEVAIDEREAADAKATQAAKSAKQKSSLDAVLASLQATKKANVLDKSRGDWTAFKTSDTGAKEELEAHLKGNKKYLDKVDFLKRTELNEYEKETASRLKGDIRLR